ncbi:hypothetical protein AB4Y90_09130 [Chryseobacterium sp. 2TAF14]|uniref:hypothetical protein n=1 Tax=Chryseobacterium sp. 2TAF14 TaxID=3233007 RepID=UPI003F8FC5DA
MKNLFIWFFLSVSNFIFAQSKVLINNNLNIVEDTLKRKKITDVLSQYILDKSVPNKDLTIINPKNKLETWLFLDELRNQQNSKIFTTKYTLMYEVISAETTDKSNYTIYLNCYFEDEKIKHSVAKIQIGVQEINNKFLISSTLKKAINNWKSKTLENYTFYSEKIIDEKKLKNFIAKNNQISLNLNEQKLPTKVYCVDGFLNAYKLLGIDYRTGESNIENFLLGIDFATDSSQSAFIVATQNGKFESFSFGSLWKARINKKYPQNNFYLPVAEGYSYINDGDPFYKWEQIWIHFKNTYSASQKTDWLSLYGHKENFSLASTSLYLENILNAIIVRKIEKEKGFNSVLELLTCGKFNREDHDNYFKTLERVSGITKSNFNEKIDELITAENKNNQ